MEIEQARTLAKLFAQKFIARPDLVANQLPDGSYRPARNPETKVPTEGFNMTNLLAHIQGERTLGHYLINTDNKTKLFVLDVDIIKGESKLPFSCDTDGVWVDWRLCNAREIWQSRARENGTARLALKFEMRCLANALCGFIWKELGLQTAAAYSGSKGMHVYGFMPEAVTADRARKAALITLEACRWVLRRGNNIFCADIAYEDMRDPQDRLASNFEIEVYPKQDSLDDKDLGNLVRLPLGVNLHSPNRDPAFFLDLRRPLTDFMPMDPVEALTSSNIWAYPDEQRKAA